MLEQFNGLLKINKKSQKKGKIKEFIFLNEPKDLFRKNVTLFMSYLWYSIFKTNLRIFWKPTKNFVFDNLLKTDGVAVSINIIPKDKYENKRENFRKKQEALKKIVIRTKRKGKRRKNKK